MTDSAASVEVETFESSLDNPHFAGIGVSVRGAGHVQRGTVCQDAHVLTQCGAYLIACIADGAGSAALSDVGSRLAVESLSETLRDRLPSLAEPISESDWVSLVRTSFESTRTRVVAEAESRGVAVRDLATTLGLVVARRDLVVAAQVGDGILVVDDGSELRPLARRDQGEYLNETTFITNDGALSNLEVSITNVAVQALALSTDGLQAIAIHMATGQPHAPFFRPLFSHLVQQSHEHLLSEMSGLLRSSRVADRTDDDLTLVLVRSKAEAGAAT